METFQLLLHLPSIMNKICCRISKIQPLSHGENVLIHILFADAFCEELQCANLRATLFLKGPGSYEYRLFKGRGPWNPLR